MEKQMELFSEGGLRDEGGTVEPESGNKVPSGSLKEEVADDIPIMISEGEFVFPADVVRYIGLNTLMKMRQDAKQGLKMMEKMGQMGNPEEAELPDDIPFGMADLIVIGSDDDEEKEEKAEGGVVGLQEGSLIDPRDREARILPIRGDEPRGGGGLFDDPRFKDQKSQEVPTYTEEDEKNLTDSLLGTAYGDVVMKRYVGPDGEVMYVPFINGEPQLAIPEGFKEDSEAPSAPTTSVSSSGDDRQEDESERARGDSIPTPLQPMTIEKPVLLTRPDGTKITNINQMTTDELVNYYESFNSNINRYASALGALFFGPIGGLIIGSAQTINNKYGVNGLSSVEKLLLQKKDLTAAQRSKLSKIAGELKQKGAGGLSIVRTITNALGLTKKEGEGKTEFQKAIEKGNISGAVNQIKTPLIKSNLKNVDIDDYANNILNMPVTLGVTAEQDEKFKEAQQEQQMKDIFEFGRGPRPVEVEQIDVTPISLAVDETKKGTAFTATGEETDALSLQELIAQGIVKPKEETVGKRADRIERERLEQERIEKERFEREQERLERERKRKEEQAAQQAAAEKARIEREEQEKQIYNPVSDPEDKGGSTTTDFYQPTPYQPNPQSTYTTTYNPPAPTGRSPGAMGGPSSPSYGTDSGYGYGGSDVITPFYVGGVPTKPMKPQRLKKGGLAKMKVKSKQMKKGGLASRKK